MQRGEALRPTLAERVFLRVQEAEALGQDGFRDRQQLRAVVVGGDQRLRQRVRPFDVDAAWMGARERTTAWR